MTEPIEEPEPLLSTSYKFYDENGVLRFERDAENEVYREWDGDGTLLSTRPFNDEDRAADALVRQQAQLEQNRQLLVDGIQNVIIVAQARKTLMANIKAMTNADINANPARHIKDISDAIREMSGDIIRISRIAGGMLDSTDGINAAESSQKGRSQ